MLIEARDAQLTKELSISEKLEMVSSLTTRFARSNNLVS